MSLHRLTGLDSSFLAAERPGNLLHVMGILVLDPTTVPGGYTFDGFRRALADRLHLVPPLRRRLLEIPGGLARPLWVEETSIDLDLHLRRAAVPQPGGPREMAAMAAEIMERPLDHSRPLWEMTAVEGLEGGRLAVIAKISHAMMDGIAGVAHMAALFGTTPDARPPPAEATLPPESTPGELALLAGSIPWLARQPRRATRAAYRTILSALRRGWGGRGVPDAPSVHVPHSWLNARVTPQRIAATATLPMDRMRAVGHDAGATVNDVLLAVVAGALRRYLEPRGALPEESLVAAVPLATRAHGDDRANAVTSVAVPLATCETDPVARLRAIGDATSAAKQRRGSTVGEDLAAWADVPPPFVFTLISRAYIDLALYERVTPICNLVVSSVPGPRDPLYLGGARLLGLYPLGPIFSGMALNVTAMGFPDGMDVGLVGCRGRMPDLWELADGLSRALDELADALPSVERRSAATGGDSA